MDSEPATGFDSLGLKPALISALKKLGYERPTPIQAATIPLLIEGKDVLGTAQTGTGKTAAFALPILNKLNLRLKKPQALILAPTRELAIQVSEAFQQYAAGLQGFHVLPIYGGQDYGSQLRAITRGPQVIVGTPGRLMDHLKRGSLSLESVSTIVLDEADEMLRMGFIDDVEWILEQAPKPRQVVLFSATMPPAIQRVTARHLTDGQEVRLQGKSQTAANIEHCYWYVRGIHKLDALTRILEVESFDAVLVFVRTKVATQELADRLEARGHSAGAINGDMNQNARELVIRKLKKGKIDILVATDVAARGIDVGRISHVINYDIPYDPEAYVHRVGRTGRAGRTGKAIMFVSPREKRLLLSIERATKQRIVEMTLPGSEQVQQRRVDLFKEQVARTLQHPTLDFFTTLVREIAIEQSVSADRVGAALAFLQQRERPLQVSDVPRGPRFTPPQEKSENRKAPTSNERHRSKSPQRPREQFERRVVRGAETDGPQVLYRLEVGAKDGARVGDIVGAISNEAGIENRFIGRIQVFAEHSTIALPAGMPKDVFQLLRRVRVRQKPLRISEVGSTESVRFSKPTAKSPKARHRKGGLKGKKLKKSSKKRKRE